MKDAAYYDDLRRQLNTIRSELNDAPKEFKHGYAHSVGSILAAYREGDIYFSDACKLLRMAGTDEVDRMRLESFANVVKNEVDRLLGVTR